MHRDRRIGERHVILADIEIVGDVGGDDFQLLLQGGRVVALEQRRQAEIAGRRRRYLQLDHQLAAAVRQAHVHHLLDDDLVSRDRRQPTSDCCEREHEGRAPPDGYRHHISTVPPAPEPWRAYLGAIAGGCPTAAPQQFYQVHGRVIRCYFLGAGVQRAGLSAGPLSR
jgi:hypothetical protein